MNSPQGRLYILQPGLGHCSRNGVSLIFSSMEFGRLRVIQTAGLLVMDARGMSIMYWGIAVESGWDVGSLEVLVEHLSCV